MAIAAGNCIATIKYTPYCEQQGALCLTAQLISSDLIQNYTVLHSHSSTACMQNVLHGNRLLLYQRMPGITCTGAAGNTA